MAHNATRGTAAFPKMNTFGRVIVTSGITRRGYIVGIPEEIRDFQDKLKTHRVHDAVLLDMNPVGFVGKSVRAKTWSERRDVFTLEGKLFARCRNRGEMLSAAHALARQKGGR